MMSSEIAEAFRMMREDEQAARAKRRADAPRILAQHDVGFVAYNEGAHLLVRGHVDLWPGTGNWVDRVTTKRGRGVFALLRHLGVSTDAQDVLE